MAESRPEAIETLAGCMTDGPVTAEHRALARAQLLAQAPPPRRNLPRREAALGILRAAGQTLAQPAQALVDLAEAAGPAFGARVAAVAGQLETAGFDLATLIIDLEQGNYPQSLGE